MKNLIAKLRAWLREIVAEVVREQLEVTHIILRVESEIAKDATQGIRLAISDAHAAVQSIKDGIHEHITAELDKRYTQVADAAVRIAQDTVRLEKRSVRAVCDVCNRMVVAWHVLDGKVECADCKIRRES